MSVLRYAVIDSDIGPVFLAATAKGLCALRLLYERPNEEITSGLEDLAKRFPGLDPREDTRGLSSLGRQVKGVIAGQVSAEGIPLDMPGTAFQKRVWETLVRLPWGRTCTYSELATLAGQPRAVRAAASACARNPVAFVVPCHRVLRRGGNLGGYYYGLPIKQRLLERERPRETRPVSRSASRTRRPD